MTEKHTHFSADSEGDISERLRKEAFEAIDWNGETMKQWDKIRALCAKRDGSDLPRLMFESLIESLSELMIDGANEIDRLRQVMRDAAQPTRESAVIAAIDPFTRGAFTGWMHKSGDDMITLDEAEDHFSLCMADMMEAAREAASQPSPAATVETINMPFERLPQHAGDPGFGHVPNVVPLPSNDPNHPSNIAADDMTERAKNCTYGNPDCPKCNPAPHSSAGTANAIADEIDNNLRIGADHRFSDDEARIIQSALRAVPQTAAWRPMETAPKQSRVLYVNRYGEIGHCSWYEAKNDGEEACWWDEERDDEVVPLGWMPKLPVWSASSMSRPHGGGK